MSLRGKAPSAWSCMSRQAAGLIDDFAITVTDLTGDAVQDAQIANNVVIGA